MDEIKRFLNCSVPVSTCNLRCRYCFVTQSKEFEKKVDQFPVSPIDIAKALTKKRLGGACLINLCGLGETLLPKEIIEIVRLLLKEGHFVSIVTNTTLTNRIQMLCQLEENLRKKLFMKCSFQYEELVRLGMIDKYFENISMLRENGISYTIEIVANDEIIDKIQDIRVLFEKKQEAFPHILESRNNVSNDIHRLTELPIEKHQQIWSQFNSSLFESQQQLWGERRKEFCYAGEFSADVDLRTGNMTQCNRAKRIQNIYKNIDEPLQFCAIGNNCPTPHCFISYVWQGLCGNIEEINYPNYAQVRNRVRTDGMSWLNEVIEKAFSKKISEIQPKYSGVKKAIVNGFMKAYYSGAESVEVDDLQIIKEWTRTYCKNNNIKTIAIYGMAGIGEVFYKILLDTEIEVVRVIDNRESVVEKYAEAITANQLWNGELLDKKVDAMIITPISDNRYVEREVKKTYPNISKIMNIVDIINKME